MKYAFMLAHEAEFSVQAMARVLVVSRSGYYEWKGRPESARAKLTVQRDEKIRQEFENQKQRYGAPRLVRELADQQVHCNVKTVAASLRRQGLRAKAGKKFQPVTTDSNHALPVYDNELKQDFQAPKANEKWAGDITYLRVATGWVYLAVVIDLFSRRVVGWAMAEHMKASLVCEALEHALNGRSQPQGVIVHTDRGSQYCSDAYRQLISDYELVGSMSAKGCCYDNACVESFFHSLKVEATHGESWQDLAQIRQAVFEYIEVDYNRKRRHSACHYLSPEVYEMRAAA